MITYTRNPYIKNLKHPNCWQTKKDTTKVTLYHDLTTRSRIEGEWPCLILNFMNKNPDNCHLISLKPLLFALEDNANN